RPLPEGVHQNVLALERAGLLAVDGQAAVDALRRGGEPDGGLAARRDAGLPRAAGELDGAVVAVIDVQPHDRDRAQTRLVTVPLERARDPALGRQHLDPQLLPLEPPAELERALLDLVELRTNLVFITDTQPAVGFVLQLVTQTTRHPDFRDGPAEPDHEPAHPAEDEVAVQQKMTHSQVVEDSEAGQGEYDEDDGRDPRGVAPDGVPGQGPRHDQQ